MSKDTKNDNWIALNSWYDDNETAYNKRISYSQFEAGWELSHSRKSGGITEDELKMIKDSVK